MSLCNLNFEECGSKIQELITNTKSKYQRLTTSVDPKNVIRDLTELDKCIEVILSSTFSNSI